MHNELDAPALDFYLPELRVRLLGRHPALVARLARILRARFSESPLPPLPRATLVLECTLSDTQTIAAPGTGRRLLEHGFRCWDVAGADAGTTVDRGAASLMAPRVYLGNGFSTVELPPPSELTVRIRVHPGFARRPTAELEHCVDHTLSLALPRLGYFPLHAGVARGVAAHGPAIPSRRDPRGSERGPGRQQVLVLGERALREATLDAMAACGWEIGGEGPGYLRRGEGGVYVVGAGARVPVLFPRRIVFFDEALSRLSDLKLDIAHGERGASGAGPAAALPTRTAVRPLVSHFRNVACHIERAHVTHEPILTDSLRRERDALVRDLLAQCTPLKVHASVAGARRAVQQTLTLLGLRESRGWDLPPPRARRQAARVAAPAARIDAS